MKVGVIFGGPSPEHDVSILTGLQAGRVLEQAGREVCCIYWSKAGDFFETSVDLEARDFLEGPPKSSRALGLNLAQNGGFFYTDGRFGRRLRRLEIDVLLNACHGGPGEDGTLQAALDLCGIPYTGPSFYGASVGMDKYLFYCLARDRQIPVLERVAGSAHGIPRIDFDPPFIVKPRFGGSSIGIEVVSDLSTLESLVKSSVHLQDSFVVEPYREDLFDVNIAVKTWPRLELSAVERPIREDSRRAVLDYEQKYMRQGGLEAMAREVPAKLDPPLLEAIQKYASDITDAAMVRSVARIDFLSDGKDVFLNEINTIPGALAVYLWVEPRLEPHTLFDQMIEEAVERPARKFDPAGAEGSLLRVAGSIASKLA
jgi:D-alanine-D-alanine ligase